MLFGIAILDDIPFRIDCSITLSRGSGEVIILGPVESAIEELLNNGIGFAQELAELDDRPFPLLSDYNLTVRIRLPLSGAPLVGPSYGLLLQLRLILGLLRLPSPIHKIAVTGTVDFDGKVHSVGAIQEKLAAAAYFGADSIILPASQLDFFNQHITQIPVSSIFEAYATLTYGQAKRTADVRS